MRILSAFLWASLLAGIAHPDATAADSASNRGRTGHAEDSAARIRVDVNMTLVPITVMDGWGRNVLGLHRGNFRVFDGAEQRPIAAFARLDAPISVGLIYDSSGSMRSKFGIARQAPVQLFEKLNPEDEAFLVTVSDRSVLRNDFTSDFGAILNRLLFIAPSGTTSLLDGVHLALQRIRHAHNPRRALIIVSDGGDNHSRFSRREMSRMASESEAQIFSICLYQSPQSDEEIEGPELLDKLVKVSGGINFMIDDPAELPGAFTQIGVALHNQYLIGYYPPEDARAGTYRKVKVQLVVPVGTPHLDIFARSGYFVPGR